MQWSVSDLKYCFLCLSSDSVGSPLKILLFAVFTSHAVCLEIGMLIYCTAANDYIKYYGDAVFTELLKAASLFYLNPLF